MTFENTLLYSFFFNPKVVTKVLRIAVFGETSFCKRHKQEARRWNNSKLILETGK
jgi:hypothetical protein